METFYLTYPQRIQEKRNCYTEIKASSYDAARAIAFKVLGTEWSFLYPAEQFLGNPDAIVKYPNQIEAYSLIEIPLL